MSYPVFKPEELNVVAEIPRPAGFPGNPVLNYPMNPGDACRLMYIGKAPWEIMSNMDVGAVTFNPYVLPDVSGRGHTMDATTIPGEIPKAGKDLFGVEWEFVVVAGGAMVRPGQPRVEDANDLESNIKWPDIEEWDWEGCRKANEELLSSFKGKCVSTTLFSGYFERLISLMDFENALIAIVDEEQKDAVNAFLDKLSDLYIQIIEKLLQVFPEIDVFYIHDDWGSQKNSFFSPAVCAEMIVPHMRKVNDRIHELGKFAHCHSCGMMTNQIENLIAAGYDAWDPQPVNDIDYLYENYGDKIVLGIPSRLDIEHTTEEEQRAYAREFAAKYCKPEKPSMLSMYADLFLTAMAGSKPSVSPAFLEELYIQTRKNYRNND